MSDTITGRQAELRSPEQKSATRPRAAGNHLAKAERHTENFDEVLSEELEFVTKGTSNELSGLAISGGGIRSASFGMGVMQALVADKDNTLQKFHYLSTVSGGGYLGSSLTWFLKQGLPNPSGGSFPAGTAPESFPFGARNRPAKAVQPDEASQSRETRLVDDTADRTASQNAILNYIRQHAQYLTPTPQLNLFSFLAVVLRATFVSLFVYFTLLTGLMGALIGSGLLSPLTGEEPGWLTGWITGLITDWLPGVAARFAPLVAKLSSPLWNPLLVLSLLVTGLLAWMSLLYSFFTRVARVENGYRMRTGIQRVIGYISASLIALVVLGVLPLAYYAVDFLSREYFHQDTTVSSLLAGAGSTVLGTLLGASEGRQQAQIAKKSGLFDAIRPTAAVGLLLYGLLLTSLVTADHLRRNLPGLLIVLGCAGVLFGLITNLNYLGVHRMYRDRLMELFTPGRQAILKRSWALAQEADRTGIDQFCGLPKGECQRPYHLINANVVLVDSSSADFRGRGGDSFVFSPKFCGSRATGWIRSREYMPLGSQSGMTLPSAMAISGAAVNPNTGVAGHGITRGRVVSMLLTLLNLRLGYWAPNPRTQQMATPNFIQPGLRAGLFASGLHEKAHLVELTDGGHFENLGIYELVRRKVKYIVVSDGGADESFEFSDLANAVERVRVDFGVKIEFKGDFRLRDILPGSGPEQPPSLDAKFQLARHGFAEGTVRYPGDDVPSGKIIYFKGTIIPNLPADVLGYKLAHPAFPHESTGDQFFDEVQFEAYRELGYHIGWQWLESVEERAKANPAARADPEAPAASGVRDHGDPSQSATATASTVTEMSEARDGK